MTVFCKTMPWSQNKEASPIDFTPEFQKLWTAHPRDRVFGSKTDAFPTQFIEFSICHPMYDDELKVVQLATTSALHNQGQPLPSYCSQIGWKTAPTLFTKRALTIRMFALYMNIPKTKVRSSSKVPLPEPTWGIRILACWNKAAWKQLITTTHPGWKTKNKTYRQQQSGITTTQAPYLFFN
jgi:hypothetical protein